MEELVGKQYLLAMVHHVSNHLHGCRIDKPKLMLAACMLTHLVGGASRSKFQNGIEHGNVRMEPTCSLSRDHSDSSSSSSGDEVAGASSSSILMDWGRETKASEGFLPCIRSEKGKTQVSLRYTSFVRLSHKKLMVQLPSIASLPLGYQGREPVTRGQSVAHGTWEPSSLLQCLYNM